MAGIDWSAELSKVGRCFRLGMEAQGCTELLAVIDRLIPLMGELPAASAVPLQELLGQALAAQERKDFLLVADLLEYEAAPLLQQLLPGQEV